MHRRHEKHIVTNGWRFRRYHFSFLLGWFAGGVLAGILASQYIGFPVLFCGSIALLAIIFSLYKRTYIACAGLVLAGILVGGARGSAYLAETSAYDQFIGQKVTMRAVVNNDPVRTAASLWQLQLSSVVINNTKLPGEIFATISTTNELKRGDSVVTSDELLDGFGSFQAKISSAKLISLERQSNALQDLRENFSAGVRRVVPEPEASLGVGFVVGQRSSLPPKFDEQLQTVGLTHIVVASGYNLTILVRFARRIFRRISKYIAFVTSLGLATGFVFFSGFSPSMNRAAVVTGLSLLAWYYGRRFHPVQLIVYVAAASALMYPVYLWSDIGWLLSFAAFTGVLVVAPILTKLLFTKKEPGAFVQLLIETLSAECMTLPIVMVVFGYVPVFALITNMLVGPILPFAMLATLIAGIVGMCIPYFDLLAAPSSIVVAYVVSIVKWFADISFSRIELTIQPWIAWLWYGLLALLGFGIYRKKRMSLDDSSIIE